MTRLFLFLFIGLSLLGYSQENTIWHAKALIDRHLVTPGDIMDAFDNALDIDEN